MRRDLRWVAIGAAFIVVAYLRCGFDGALMYASSYLLALALGIDGVLVMSLMLMNARIPAGDQTSMMRFSFGCALGLRAAVLVGAVFVVHWYAPAHYAVGAWLVYEAAKSFRTDPFATRSEQKSRGLLASIALVELAFAADALAAIAITDMLFVLVASNLLATAAIRSMSRTIMMAAPRLKPLRMASLGLLSFSGVLLVARDQIFLSPAIMLGIVAAVLGTGYVMSLRRA